MTFLNYFLTGTTISYIMVIFLSSQTDRPKHMAQTQIRVLLKEKADQGPLLEK